MKEWIALGGLGTGLFVVALVGTLAVQGRLDYEGTRGIPWVSTLFEPPDDGGATAVESGPPTVQSGASTGERAPAPGGTAAATPRPRAGEPAGAEASVQDGAAAPAEGLFRFPQLDSGFTAEDLERVLQAARAAEEAARLERARVEALEAGLLVRERDLEDRASAIAEQMLRVDHERQRLEQRIADFERKVLVVERDELRGLREYGRSLAAFEPARAAALVLEEWETDAGRKRIVKVLAVMDPADADAILVAIDETRVREILLQRLRVVHEPSGR